MKKRSRNYEKSEKGKEKNNERNRNWSKTPKGIKGYTKKNWKKRGLNMDTFEEVYEKYLQATKCELCSVEFEKENCGKQKCMDHCHETGEFRNIVCRNCNMNVIR